MSWNRFILASADSIKRGKVLLSSYATVGPEYTATEGLFGYSVYNEITGEKFVSRSPMRAAAGWHQINMQEMRRSNQSGKAAWTADVRECPNRIEPELPRRPVNGLNVEVGPPAPRCRRKLPKHWKGVTAARWLLSGGSPLVFGRCSSSCPSGCLNQRQGGDYIFCEG